MNKYLKTKDIMEIFHFSRSKAYAIMNAPGFPWIKIGKTKYVPLDEFEKWQKQYLCKEYKLI